MTAPLQQFHGMSTLFALVLKQRHRRTLSIIMDRLLGSFTTGEL